MKHARTIYLIIGFAVAAIAAYFLYKQVRYWIGVAIRGVVTAKVVDKVSDVVTGEVTDQITEQVTEQLPGKALNFGQ